MKTHRTSQPQWLGALALAAASLTSLPAQQPSLQGSMRQGMHLQLASAETNAFWLGQYVGKPLQSTGGDQLGTVGDFLVEPQTVLVRFAVVPSGAGQGGETYRLVPVAALEHGSGTHGLSVRINKAQWDQVGTMSTEQTGTRVTVQEEQLQRLATQFALQNAGAQDGATGGEFVRASRLKNQTVRSNQEQLGTVETVAIDLPRRVAAVVLKSTASGSEQRFLVPFDRLQWSGDVNAGATTSLTRNDLQQAQGALSPTGLTNGAFTPNGAQNQAVQAAAQQASNSASGNANVRVSAETWLVIRGTVDSEQKRQEVERAVQQAAPGLQIDNKTTVRAP